MQFMFDNQKLDTGRRELRRGWEPISVEPQVFDLLAYLVQNHDRVVSKDDQNPDQRVPVGGEGPLPRR